MVQENFCLLSFPKSLHINKWLKSIYNRNQFDPQFSLEWIYFCIQTRLPCSRRYNTEYNIEL